MLNFWINPFIFAKTQKTKDMELTPEEKSTLKQAVQIKIQELTELSTKEESDQLQREMEEEWEDGIIDIKPDKMGISMTLLQWMETFENLIENPDMLNSVSQRMKDQISQVLNDFFPEGSEMFGLWNKLLSNSQNLN